MSKIYRWDETKNLIIQGDKTTTIAFCAQHFIACGEKAIQNHGRFTVALSGGSTPKAIYDLIGTYYAKALDWKKVYLFWSDERNVPKDSQESNYHMSMSSRLSSLGIPESHIFRMQGEGPMTDGADLYEKTLTDILSHDPFDLIMLGMGEDGHTASLFPNTEGLNEKHRKVIANYIPAKDTWRMTLTIPYINTASNIVFYVMGSSKKDAVHKAFKAASPSQFPCTLIGSSTHPALWIIDKDAASLILDNLKT
jgi:6-phosphogluconolactonase